jgi:hypothetical protein
VSFPVVMRRQRSRCSFRRRSRRPTQTPASDSDSGGTQRRVCSPWVRVTTGRNTESTMFPTDESMYGALTRVVQPPRYWQREAGASPTDDFVCCRQPLFRSFSIASVTGTNPSPNNRALHCLSVSLTDLMNAA